jgi:hypothetical protein
MKNKPVHFLVLSVGFFWSLAGCGGLGKRVECPDGRCSPLVCTDNTFLSGGACVEFSVCGAGTYVISEGTPTADRICEICPSGTFSSLENSVGCTGWSTCPPGTFVSNSPTEKSDRVCVPCGAGTMTTGTNQSMCTRSNECAPGTEQTAPGTATSAPKCTDCQPGGYCPGGSLPMEPCAYGKWDDDRDPATACVAWTVCGAGTYVKSDGSSTADRECQPCSAGSFTSAENSVSCQEWTTCLPGTFVANIPSATSDRRCVVCPAGSYAEEENQSECLSPDDCPAGTVMVSSGSSSEPPVCAPCEVGQFCPGGSGMAMPCGYETWDHDANPATTCVLWTLCRPGTYIALAGSTTQDQWCFPCDDGTFTDAANSPTCAPWSDCPPGTYAGSYPTTGSDRVCMECNAGSFSTKTNANRCELVTECPANTTFVSVPATRTQDNVCTSCTDRGCTQFCDSEGRCLDCQTDADCNGALCIDSMCTAVQRR